MNALWWWIDRWRKSSAFMDMTLEQQGAYRNLLDEAALRGGPLPNDERILAKACGDQKAWRRVAVVVMKRFELREDGWHNPTLDAILRESKRRADKQRSYRKGCAHVTDAVTGDVTTSVTGSVTTAVTGNNRRPPDPDLSVQPPLPPLKGGRRRKRTDIPGGTTCRHQPRCSSTHACIQRTLEDGRHTRAAS